MKKIILYTFFLLIIVGNQLTLLAQCAMCKAAAESDLQNNPNSVAKGINEGIIYLMVIPYILMAFFFRKEIIQFIRGIIKK